MRLHNILPLPSPSTIHRYLRSIRVECGFDKDFFNDFKNKLSLLKAKTRHGVLLVDEMKVKKCVGVNPCSMKFNGLSNTDEDDDKSTDDQADYALVFLFSSVHGSFHQPIGTYLSQNATKGETLAKLMLQAIVEVEKAGGLVDGIICDGATPNRKMWTFFGISGKIVHKNKKGEIERRHASFYMPNPVSQYRVIYFFSDTPHLIKCIRNRLLERDLKVRKKFQLI